MHKSIIALTEMGYFSRPYIGGRRQKGNFNFILVCFALYNLNEEKFLWFKLSSLSSCYTSKFCLGNDTGC